MVLSVFSFSREPGPKSGVCVTVPEECEDWEREREKQKQREICGQNRQQKQFRCRFEKKEMWANQHNAQKLK